MFLNFDESKCRHRKYIYSDIVYFLILLYALFSFFCSTDCDEMENDIENLLRKKTVDEKNLRKNLSCFTFIGRFYLGFYLSMPFTCFTFVLTRHNKKQTKMKSMGQSVYKKQFPLQYERYVVFFFSSLFYATKIAFR